MRALPALWAVSGLWEADLDVHRVSAGLCTAGVANVPDLSDLSDLYNCSTDGDNHDRKYEGNSRKLVDGGSNQ